MENLDSTLKSNLKVTFFCCILFSIIISLFILNSKIVVVDSAMAQAADLESVRGDFNNEDVNNRNNSFLGSLEINNSAMSFDDFISEAADPESVKELGALNLKESSTSQNNIANKAFSLSVNKYHFLPGESIEISGSYYNQLKNGTFLPATGFVEVRLVDITNSSYMSLNPKEIMTNMEYLKYYKNIYIENGTFSELEFTSPNKYGKYLIRLSPINDPTHPNISDIIIEIVNPFSTIPFIMIYLGIISLIGLMIIIIKSGSIGFTANEVLRFIFISGIVISPILGLLFSDSELGTNSPIGLIRKHVTDNEDTNEIQAQWVINVGGLKSNNYTSGILIPIYVIIFGIAGGYLRYLYRTTTSRWNINTKENFLIFEFKWSEVPGNNEASTRLKEYLINKFDADWIRERDFVKTDDNTIKISSSDNTKTLQIKLDRTQKKAIIELGDSKIPYSLEVKNIDNVDFMVYDTTNRRIWTFYQSLSELALLFLAPLLAIATWFILTQGEDIDKYIIAVISLAVGLVTERIVNYLISFTSSKFTVDTTNK